LASEFVRKLIDSGIHFGHRTSAWNPKMRPYLFGTRNQIHITDIRETVKGILCAKKYLASIVAKGQDVLFVGTKRQARHAVMDVAQRTGMHYVAERWLGGTLTNFRTIRSRLARLEELEAIEAKGMAGAYSKKMIATLTREKRKIKRNLEGIRKMTKLPGAIVIIDVRREYISSLEARKLKIPVIGLIDTDSDPDFVDIPIPGNDDAMRAIELVLEAMVEAIEEGKRARPIPAAAADAGSSSRGPGAGRRSGRAAARAEGGPEPAGAEGSDVAVPGDQPATDSAAAPA
jgi:small subunit ribosomal protein S2